MDQEKDYLPHILEDLRSRKVFLIPDHYFTKNIDHTVSHLQSLSSIDSKISIKHPWKVPNQYFENNLEKNLSNIHLIKNRQQEQFAIPQNYFEQLNNQVMQKIRKEEAQAPVRKFQFLHSRVIGIAALFVVIFGLFIIKMYQSPKQTEFNLSQIDDEALIEYVSMNETDVNQFTDLVDDQNFTGLDIESSGLDDQSVDELLKLYQ